MLVYALVERVLLRLEVDLCEERILVEHEIRNRDMGKEVVLIKIADLRHTLQEKDSCADSA